MIEEQELDLKSYALEQPIYGEPKSLNFTVSNYDKFMKLHPESEIKESFKVKNL